MNDITFTNFRLAKIGYVPNDLCTCCGIEPETVHHLFYECFFTKLIWTDFASFWYLVSGKREDLTLQDVLLGKLDSEIELLNYFITLVNGTVPSGTCNNRDYNNKTTIGNVWRNGGNTTPQSA